jgi:hypothetical protein
MAKTKDANPSERLQELIAERQRYEVWLAGLAARRDAAPAHVVARVEEDYRARLASIGEELGARAGELRERIAALTDRLAEIKLHEQARRDERAEAELRTAVGEFSPGQWSEISERTERELSAFEADRQLVERELGELERVLSHVTGAAPPAGRAAAQPDATRTAPAAAQPAQQSRTEQPSDGGPSAQRQPPRPAPVPQRPAQPPRPAPVPQRPAQPASAAAAPVESTNPAAAVAEPASSPAPARGTAPAPETQRRTDASQHQGQEKTLMCTECGTANYPTEWYCEACGAELANM